MASGTAHVTLPWSWYSDPETLPREKERIFRRAWQYVGPAEHAALPGEYFTSRIGDVPVLVARGREERLRAFLNVCRHRGAVLVEGRGRRETLQCHYHAWTYDLDGRLRTAPRADREPGLDTNGICLLELPVETWGPLVFVNPDTDAAPLADTLGPVPEHLAAGGIEVDRLRFRRRTDLDVACNWKIAVENYLECYHCAVAHPGFSALVDVRPDAYRLETYALSSSQFGPTKAPTPRRRPTRPRGLGPRGRLTHVVAAETSGPSPQLASEGEPGPVEGQFHWLWPVTKLYALPGPQNLVAGPLVPVSPDRTAGWFDYYFAEDVSDEEAEELIAFDDQVGLEDRRLVESVQRGVGSGLLDSGRLLPQSERLLAHFQQLVREALA